MPDLLREKVGGAQAFGAGQAVLAHPETANLVLGQCVEVFTTETGWKQARTEVAAENKTARLANLRLLTSKKKGKSIEEKVDMEKKLIEEKHSEELQEMDLATWKKKKTENPFFYVLLVQYWTRKTAEPNVTAGNFWGPFEPDALLRRGNSLDTVTFHRGLIGVDNVFSIVPLESQFKARRGAAGSAPSQAIVVPSTFSIKEPLRRLLRSLPSRGAFFPTSVDAQSLQLAGAANNPSAAVAVPASGADHPDSPPDAASDSESEHGPGAGGVQPADDPAAMPGATLGLTQSGTTVTVTELSQGQSESQRRPTRQVTRKRGIKRVMTDSSESSADSDASATGVEYADSDPSSSETQSESEEDSDDVPIFSGRRKSDSVSTRQQRSLNQRVTDSSRRSSGRLRGARAAESVPGDNGGAVSQAPDSESPLSQAAQTADPEAATQAFRDGSDELVDHLLGPSPSVHVRVTENVGDSESQTDGNPTTSTVGKTGPGVAFEQPVTVVQLSPVQFKKPPRLVPSGVLSTAATLGQAAAAAQPVPHGHSSSSSSSSSSTWSTSTSTGRSTSVLRPGPPAGRRVGRRHGAAKEALTPPGPVRDSETGDLAPQQLIGSQICEIYQSAEVKSSGPGAGDHMSTPGGRSAAASSGTRRRGTTSTATKHGQPTAAAAASMGSRRNLPGSSAAAVRARKRQKTDRQESGTAAAPVPVSGASLSLTATVRRLEKGSFVVIQPTEEELATYKFRFWVGILAEDGPSHGKYKVKWMSSFVHAADRQQQLLEFGAYSYWLPIKTVEIQAADVVYTFKSLSARKKIKKRDQLAICKLFAIKLEPSHVEDE